MKRNLGQLLLAVTLILLGLNGLGVPLGIVPACVALACLLAAAVVLFMAGGWWLDRWLGVFPLLTILGAVAGAVFWNFRHAGG